MLQGALLGVVGLILAFRLSLAVGRYEDRRAAVVAEANAIGTTYLRAQLLAEPARTRSLALLREYTDLAIRLSHDVPNSSDMRRTAAAEGEVRRDLWRHAGEAMGAAPVASAPRLYVDSLNSMIDMQTVRVSGLNNRVPGAVLALEVIGAAAALGLLGLYLSCARPRRASGRARGGARVRAASRDLRPRSARARLDHHPLDAARDPACVNGASARGGAIVRWPAHRPTRVRPPCRRCERMAA